MLIKELRWKGLPVWPPLWVEGSPKIIEHGSLKSVDILPITDLIKIKASYEGTIITGLILSNKQYQGSLYRKLNENIGKPLDEVANMEVYC